MKKLILMLGVALLLTGCTNKEDYKNNLKNTSEKILENSSDAEELVGVYTSIWNLSIKGGTALGVSEVSNVTGISEEDINEHFTLNSIGNVPGDFSTNINSLNNYFEVTGKLDGIRSKSKEIKDDMGKLNKPPKDYEKAYDELLEMYASSEEYIKLATDPSGSYQSYTDDGNRLSRDIINRFNKIEAILPNE